MKKRLLTATMITAAMILAAGCTKTEAPVTSEVQPEPETQTQEAPASEATTVDWGDLKEDTTPEGEETPKEEEEKEKPAKKKREKKCKGQGFSDAEKYIKKNPEADLSLSYSETVYTPEKRVTEPYALDEMYFDSLSERAEKESLKRLRLKRSDTGSYMDAMVYTSEETMLIDRIITVEFCAYGREVSDYLFEDGNLSRVITYTGDIYGTVPDHIGVDSKVCYFRDDYMSFAIVDDKAAGFKHRSFSAADAADSGEFIGTSFDELEADLLNKAYITYDTVKDVPGTCEISGYVGDEYGGVLSHVKLTLRSRANNYTNEFETNGDGYFSVRVPINEDDYYSLVCDYGDFVQSTVDDIKITPGNLEYSLGVIYMAQAGQNVHDANTYLLNANYTSPKKLKDGEYCVTFTTADGGKADLACYTMDLDSKKISDDTMRVVKKGDRIKYFVVDKRGLDSGNPMTYELSGSGAVVRVYTNKGMVASYQAKVGSAGTVWEVLEIRDGALIPISNLLIESTKQPFLK